MFSPHGMFSPVQVIGALIVLVPCLVFWGWMFRTVIVNDDLPGSAKENWTFALNLLNLVAAAIYYNAVYRHRHYLRLIDLYRHSPIKPAAASCRRYPMSW
jgi:hypothetical protein